MAQEFQWNDDKSKKNLEKHGILFERGVALWADRGLIILKSKSEVDEVRFLNIGKIEDKFFTAITTSRDNSIRIISIRRSRKNEVALYEEKNFGK